MQTITLSSDQLSIFQSARDGVQLIDSSGNLLAHVVKAISPEVIAAALESSNSDRPWHKTREVLEHLESLES